MKANYFLSILFLSFLYESAFSQQILNASRLTGEITLDGKVEESAWDAVQPLPYRISNAGA